MPSWMVAYNKRDKQAIIGEEIRGYASLSGHGIAAIAGAWHQDDAPTLDLDPDLVIVCVPTSYEKVKAWCAERDLSVWEPQDDLKAARLRGVVRNTDGSPIYI